MTELLTSPDVTELAEHELPQREFPAGRNEPFRAYFAPEAHADIWQHARQDTTVEICGVLVGKVERDDDGPFVRIAHAIRCDSATSKFAEVTFTHESWAEINRRMDSEFTEFDVVGWYHTHPDFGIFLSDRDCFIHQNFFSGPGQVAHVVDPIRQTEGVFCWRAGKPIPLAHFWIGDRLVADTHTESVAVGGPERRMPAASAPVTRAGAVPSSDNSPLPLSWQSFLQGLLPLVLVFLVFALIFTDWRHGRLTDWERRTLVQGVVRDYSLWKGVRLGLGEELDTLQKNLQTVEKAARSLAADHTSRLDREQRAATQKSWQDVLAQIGRLEENVRQLADRYALTPEEADLVRRLQQSAANAKPQPSDKPATAEKPSAATP